MTSGSNLKEFNTGVLSTPTQGYRSITTSWGGTDRPSYKRAFYSVYTYTNRRGRRHFKKVPLYRKPLPSVKDAPHPWNKNILDQSRQPGFSGVTPVNSIGWSWTEVTPSWNANDDNRLLAKLREAFLGSSFDLGVFLGTGHQSLQTIGETALKLVNCVRLLKKGRFLDASHALGNSGYNHQISKKRKRNLVGIQSSYNQLLNPLDPFEPSHINIYRNGKRVARKRNPLAPRKNKVPAAGGGFYDLSTPQSCISSAWLELQYGWKPLLSDLKTGAEALAESTRTKRKRYFSSLRKEGKDTDVRMNLSSNFISASKCLSFRSRRLIAYVEETNVPTMRSLLDPLPVLWELAPWSFIADWVIPIGEYLYVRGMASRVTGTFVTTELIYRKASSFVKDGGIYRFPGNNFTRLIFNRTVSTTLTSRFPTVKPLGSVASWAHAENALALLQQTLHR